MEFGSFLNEYAQDARNFWTISVGLVLALAFFGWFFNRRIDAMKEDTHGKTSFLVAGGIFFTLAFVAVLSWKAALLGLVAFTVSGVFMIYGDVMRSISRLEKENNRRKRKPLPYAAAAIIDDAIMGLSESQRAVKEMLRNGIHANQVGLIGMQIADVIGKLVEARKVEGE